MAALKNTTLEEPTLHSSNGVLVAYACVRIFGNVFAAQYKENCDAQRTQVYGDTGKQNLLSKK